MKGALASPVAAATTMQESFGCAVANRFHQLLDDESDPFDILREAEQRKQQSKKREEAAFSTGRKPGPGAAATAVKRESQKERKGSPFLQSESPPAPGMKREGACADQECDKQLMLPGSGKVASGADRIRLAYFEISLL